MEIIPTEAYGTTGAVFNSLKSMTIERTPLRVDEVHTDVLYCGVCHSDLHQVKNDWHKPSTPACRATRLSAASRRRAAPSPSLKWAT